jgi:hypothetical protein
MDPTPPPRRKPSLIPLGIMGLILVTGLVLLWRGSLTRPLSDEALARQLAPDASDADAYHAIEQLSRRIERKDADAKRFYPAVVALSSSPHNEKRKVAAWVMGFDPEEESFHAPLLRLVDDRVPVVAYNAALSLVRRRSDAGRPALLAMLKPSPVAAPESGTFRPKSKVGQTADPRAPFATIEAGGREVPVAAFVPGKVLSQHADGARVAAGETVATVGAAPAYAFQALRALTLPGIGRPEDAEVIEAFLRDTPSLNDETREQAQEAIAAVRGRR